MPDTKTVDTKTTKTTSMEVKNKAEPLIYVGPNIRTDFLLSKMTVFHGGVSIFTDKRQELKELFIPVSQLAKAKLELKDPKSKLHKAYIDAQKKEHETLLKKEAK